MRRNADAGEPRVFNRHSVPVALPDIRLDPSCAARDLSARRNHVRRRLRTRPRARTRATRGLGASSDVPLKLVAIAACCDGPSQFYVDSIHLVDSCAAADVVQVVSMASRDTGGLALRVDADGGELRIRFCRDVGSDRRPMVRSDPTEYSARRSRGADRNVRSGIQPAKTRPHCGVVEDRSARLGTILSDLARHSNLTFFKIPGP